MYKKHPRLNYYISDEGIIMKTRGCGQKKTYIDKNGYEVFTRNGCLCLVHRLVYETFCGNIPQYLEINHINGIKSDNRMINLEIVTKSENIKHAVDMRLKPSMVHETNGMAKLSKSQYLEIINMIIDGYSNSDIGKKYGLHSRYISLIRGKKRLKSLWLEVEFNQGLKFIPISNDKSKLSFDERIKLLKDLAYFTNKEIANIYNLDISTISKIRSKKAWLNLWNVYEERCNDQSIDVGLSKPKREAS